jgi:hypothetical protein
VPVFVPPVGVVVGRAARDGGTVPRLVVRGGVPVVSSSRVRIAADDVMAFITSPCVRSALSAGRHYRRDRAGAVEDPPRYRRAPTEEKCGTASAVTPDSGAYT